MESIALLCDSQIVEKFFYEEIREQKGQVTAKTKATILGKSEGSPGATSKWDMARAARI
jgi:hypothetical protein